jgi:hypothetical protein
MKEVAIVCVNRQRSVQIKDRRAAANRRELKRWRCNVMQ